jgi:hypothetical protein
VTFQSTGNFSGDEKGAVAMAPRGSPAVLLEPQLVIFQLPSVCLQPTPLPWFGRPVT